MLTDLSFSISRRRPSTLPVISNVSQAVSPGCVALKMRGRTVMLLRSYCLSSPVVPPTRRHVGLFRVDRLHHVAGD